MKYWFEVEVQSGHPVRDLRWLEVLQNGLQQIPYLLELHEGDQCVAKLPLSFVKSLLFGRYLVGLPYLNSGGVDLSEPEEAATLIDAAKELTDQLDCRYLELRHEEAVNHSCFNAELTQKVHMRLPLPDSEESMWDQLKSKVRSQVRKGLKNEFESVWGREELLDDFYELFCLRMHQLGTPVYSRKLFESILQVFSEDAEICCVRNGGQTIASGLLIHGRTITEVPSASSLVEYNSQNANMVLYWHLLTRAIERGSSCFDFGRATRESGTHRFKKQWGAEESPTAWQYYVRRGSAGDLRPDSSKNQRRVEMWKKLPLWVTKWYGPTIVRGIP
ncbi:MAG: FemAB family PEP-CTERM system-associated protein [Planctomycetaceae bacterium]|nr:FemAB family PEP-CTERM system-associated protein [Planctomycetaceae bacterium]